VTDVVRRPAAFDPNKAELYRKLLEQFYEDSVGRYGLDHDQVRLLSRLLTRDGPAKSDSANS
jgi:hypothetical protein